MQSSEGGTAKPPQAEDAVDRCLAEVRERADFSDACCVMGAASVYRRALARCVSSLGAEAKVINPIVTGWRKKNIRKAKTDSEDASSIASVYFAGLCLAQWHMNEDAPLFRGRQKFNPTLDKSLVAFPRIEKILIDCFCGDVPLDPAQVREIFSNAFSTYFVNLSVLERYARSRGKKEEILSLLNELDLEEDDND